jgi:predicted hydrolase (HD superfamily)
MSAGSVTKKLKQKAFAAAVSREAIVKGAEILGLPLEAHISNVITALQSAAEPLGLA